MVNSRVVGWNTVPTACYMDHTTQTVVDCSRLRENYPQRIPLQVLNKSAARTSCLPSLGKKTLRRGRTIRPSEESHRAETVITLYERDNNNT